MTKCKAEAVRPVGVARVTYWIVITTESITCRYLGTFLMAQLDKVELSRRKKIYLII